MTISAHPFTRIDELRPLAPAVGPFPLPGFVTAVTDLRGEHVDVLGDARGALPVTVDDRVVTVAGHPDLTDYHSPLGDTVESIVADLTGLVDEGHRLDLDSLPAEACDPLANGLRDAGVRIVVAEHTVSAVVSLPESFDDYLAALSKKQRHEVRQSARWHMSRTTTTAGR